MKFKLYDMPGDILLAQGRAERIGDQGRAEYRYYSASTCEKKERRDIDLPDYRAGINMFLKDLVGEGHVLTNLSQVDAVGFKTVLAFGYNGVFDLTDEVIEELEARMDVAPLHNKVYSQVISVFRLLLTDARFIGVFETAFHSSRPLYSRLYGVPYEWYEKDGIQRYGFHGASHGYIADRMRELCGNNRKIVSCHLGGSSSICAIADGRSMDISSGFSPQTGLPNANRVGDLDVYVLVNRLGMGESLEDILETLNGKSGLYGLSGVSSDLRDIEVAAASGNERAELAIDVLCYGIVKYVGAYYAVLGGLDYLVFTGGIGENSVTVRERVCTRLAHMGIELDVQANRCGSGEREISVKGTAPQVWVIQTDEELRVARQISEFLS